MRKWLIVALSLAWLVWELVAAFDASSHTWPLTHVIVEYVPAPITYAAIAALVIWLPWHFVTEYRKRHASREAIMTLSTPPAPVETKVKAATAGAAGSAAVVTPFAVWLVDLIAFNGDLQPEVPLPVVGFVGLVVTGLCAFAAGYWAKHTKRWDLGES